MSIPYSLLLFVIYIICASRTAIFQCDFETACNDFMVDSYWGLTDGFHPESINHDHTLNASSGHYLFYNPISIQPFGISEIKTLNWLPSVTDRALCFRMWYYTPHVELVFTVQLVQGDDENLARTVAVISGKDPPIKDWTLINVPLPNEKLRVFIRLNGSARPLVFDDISVDYCDGPPPSPSKILFQCDFESSCSDDFISLPDYPYQWSTLQASEASSIESGAPSSDYTFGNQSGHYSLLRNSQTAYTANVGYLNLLKTLEINSDQSYCLNFQYYCYGPSYTGNLFVFTWHSDETKAVRKLWPIQTSNAYM
jgi:hypothetical protein